MFLNKKFNVMNIFLFKSIINDLVNFYKIYKISQYHFIFLI